MKEGLPGRKEHGSLAHLPARSTRLSAPLRAVPEASWRPVMASMNTLCEREELAFMAVASQARATAALRTSAAATSDDATGTTVAPATWVCPPAQHTSALGTARLKRRAACIIFCACPTSLAAS